MNIILYIAITEGKCFSLNSISEEQQQLIDAVQAVHLACSLTGQNDLDINIVFHHQACNNSPGWNIFINNARFELGYEHSVVRFSIPPEENKYIECKNFLSEFGFNDFSENYRIGIKYIFEVQLDELIYTEEGIEKIAKLTDMILKYN